MDRAKKREVSSLQRGLPVLATISSSAPFVGLFGTVFGIITAFQQMADPSKGGGGGLASVSAGIAEALLTTAVGLGRGDRRRSGSTTSSSPSWSSSAACSTTRPASWPTGSSRARAPRAAGRHRALARARPSPRDRPGGAAARVARPDHGEAQGGAQPAGAGRTSTSRRSSTWCWCCSSSSWWSRR